MGWSGPKVAKVRQPMVIPSTAVDDDLPGPSVSPAVHDTIQHPLISRNLTLHPIRPTAGSCSSFPYGLHNERERMSHVRPFSISPRLISIVLLSLSALNLSVVFHYWRVQRPILPADHYSLFCESPSSVS